MNLPRTLPWLVAASAVIAILASSGALPAPLVVAFKPLTTLLILAFAWPRGTDATKQRRFIRTGLVLSLIGDVFLMWPKEGFVPGLIAFLLAHLAISRPSRCRCGWPHARSFSSSMRRSRC